MWQIMYGLIVLLIYRICACFHFREVYTTLLKIKRDSTAHFLNSLFGIKQTLIF